MTVPHRIGADWLSFSIDVYQMDPPQKRREVKGAVMQMPGITVSDNPLKHSRAPYNQCIRLVPNGRLYYSTEPGIKHAVIEIEGKGCQAMEEAGTFKDLVKWVLADENVKNVTRFDMAVDFDTDTMPREFIKDRTGRHKTVTAMDSETGSSRYVGSRKSSRYVRVYRWAEPHERAHLLRIEYVFSKPDAEGPLRRYISEEPSKFAGACGDIYGWTHPDWDLSSQEKIKAWRPERANANQLAWLRKQVMPALKSLVDEEKLDRYHPIWAEIAAITPLEYSFLPPLEGTDPNG